MELSPKLQSLSKVLQKLSEEVQRLEAQKVHYENLEKNITRYCFMYTISNQDSIQTCQFAHIQLSWESEYKQKWW